MEKTLTPLSSNQQKVEIDWTESEWFQVWLRLAKRDYQGDSLADQRAPSWIAQAA